MRGFVAENKENNNTLDFMMKMIMKNQRVKSFVCFVYRVNKGRCVETESPKNEPKPVKAT